MNVNCNLSENDANSLHSEEDGPEQSNYRVSKYSKNKSSKKKLFSNKSSSIIHKNKYFERYARRQKENIKKLNNPDIMNDKNRFTVFEVDYDFFF